MDPKEFEKYKQEVLQAFDIKPEELNSTPYKSYGDKQYLLDFKDVQQWRKRNDHNLQ